MKNAVRLIIEKFENSRIDYKNEHARKSTLGKKRAWFRRLRELVIADDAKRPPSNVTWIVDINEARKIVTDPENLKLYG